ncbi:MAG: HEPN domain-containing protein [Candidatus Aenigmarchaeota archaeon]|nr:HEPN domain-containing protein [Candidatus Aenigmarchaeota archaeon]MCX8179468.1 HEPN domain-containing protein [Candidatus Aenigmarchaeota archaeon]
MESERVGLAKQFLLTAKKDLEAAEVLFKEKNFNNSIYHSQQAVEKAIKAILVLSGKFVESHFVADMVKDVLDKESYEYAKSLEKSWIISRYPFKRKTEIWSPVNGFTEGDSRDALDKAKFVFNKISKLLEKRGVKV